MVTEKPELQYSLAADDIYVCFAVNGEKKKKILQLNYIDRFYISFFSTFFFFIAHNHFRWQTNLCVYVYHFFSLFAWMFGCVCVCVHVGMNRIHTDSNSCTFVYMYNGVFVIGLIVLLDWFSSSFLTRYYIILFHSFSIALSLRWFLILSIRKCSRLLTAVEQ